MQVVNVVIFVLAWSLSIWYTYKTYGYSLDRLIILDKKGYFKWNEGENIDSLKSVINRTLRFFAVAMLVYAVGFSTLYYISTVGFLKAVTQTGVHAPILLAVMGFIVRVITKKHSLKQEDEKRLLVACSLLMTIVLTTVNLSLGIFTFVIVIGKAVWIDFVYEYKNVKESFKAYWQLVRDKFTITPESVTIYASKMFFFYFIMPLMVVRITLAKVDGDYTNPGFIAVLVSLCIVCASGVDIALSTNKKAAHDFERVMNLWEMRGRKRNDLQKKTTSVQQIVFDDDRDKNVKYNDNSINKQAVKEKTNSKGNTNNKPKSKKKK